MRYVLNRFPKTLFVLKCVLVSELLMFGSMTAGELLIDPNLFSGFLNKPEIWYGIFLETAIATLPVCLLGAWILSKSKIQTKRNFLFASLGIWILLCLSVVVLYKIFYFPREWKLTLLHPGILFGWVIPGVLIIGCFVWFSDNLHSIRKIGADDGLRFSD